MDMKFIMETRHEMLEWENSNEIRRGGGIIDNDVMLTETLHCKTAVRAGKKLLRKNVECAQETQKLKLSSGNQLYISIEIPYYRYTHNARRYQLYVHTHTHTGGRFKIFAVKILSRQ